MLISPMDGSLVWSNRYHQSGTLMPSGAVHPIIPGWSEGPDPESRDSGFASSMRPGMTEFCAARITNHHDHALARKAPRPPADQLAGTQAPDRLFIPRAGRAVYARDRRRADHTRD